MFFFCAEKAVQAAPEKEAYFVSPLTGEKIPESKSGDHMRFGEPELWVG